MKAISLILVATLLLGINAGCRKKQPPKPKKESALSSTLDDLTGKTTIERGIKAQKDIKRISAKHNKELNDLLGE